MMVCRKACYDLFLPSPWIMFCNVLLVIWSAPHQEIASEKEGQKALTPYWSHNHNLHD